MSKIKNIAIAEAAGIEWYHSPHVSWGICRKDTHALFNPIGELAHILAMAEELKALRTQGKAVCEALESVSSFTQRLPNLLPTPEMRAAAFNMHDHLKTTLTSARVVFPK